MSVNERRSEMRFLFLNESIEYLTVRPERFVSRLIWSELRGL